MEHARAHRKKRQAPRPARRRDAPALAAEPRAPAARFHPAWSARPAVGLGRGVRAGSRRAVRAVGVQTKPAARDALHDPYEREADTAAERLLGGRPAPPISALPPGALAGCAEAPAAVRRTLEAPGRGKPLPAASRHRLEDGLGADLGAVRVHDGDDARAAAALLGARAFTRGADVWLGPGASASDVPLMAHEAVHVVQQGAAPRRAGHPPARRAAAAPVAPAAVAGGQPGLLDDIRSGLSSLAEAGAGFVWGLLEEYAPRLVPIVREVADKGIFGYLRDRVSGVVDHLFDDLDDSSGFLATLVETFNSLSSGVGALLGPLAEGNCEPLFNALTELKERVSEMAGDAWDAITEFFEPVGDFFADLWQSFGAPVLDWIREKASDVWEFLSDLGAEIWSWTEPVRDALADAWDWVKDKLGLGDDEGNSKGGLIDWIGDKLGEVWDWVEEQLRPIIEPMQRFVAKVREVLPLDAILNLRDTIQEWMQKATAMADAMEQPDGVVEEQTTLRGTILPAILESIVSLRGRIVETGAWVSEKIGAVATDLGGFLAKLREVPLARALGGVIGWLADGVTELSSWAQRTVSGLFTWVGDGLVYLSRFIEPVLDTLEELAAVVSDLAGRLSDLVLGPLWNLIPACIRDPIKDFLINQILRRIPIFNQLLELPDIWTRVQQVAMRILRQVFVDGNLAGAAWTFFSSLLELLGLPPELVVNILRKAAQAISDILGDPVGFLINLLRAVKEGFSQFFANIGRHLLGGIAGWLFGQLRSAGISPPEDLSFRSVLGFVMQVLDITTERVFQTLARHIGEERVRQLRRALDVATGVWSWVATLVNEGPAGLWERLKDELSNLWDRVLDSVIDWVTQTIIARVTVRLLSMLDPSGVMAVVNSLIAFYRAIQSFMEHLREMLEIVNTVLDGIGGIATGAIAQAANFVESALARAIPVAIGFLANQVGLRGLGTRIREMVEGLREWVWQKIDAFIAGVVRVGRAALDAMRRGIGAVRGAAGRIVAWWRQREEFVASDGERHTLRFEGEGSAATLGVNPRFTDIRTYTRDPANQIPPDDKRRIEILVGELFGLTTRQPDSSMPADPEQEGREISDRLRTIAGLLSGTPARSKVVGSFPAYRGGDQRTRTMKAMIALHPGDLNESAAGREPMMATYLTRDTGISFQRAHLLAKQLHGPGELNNLMVTPETFNDGQMKPQVEQPVATKVYRENKVVEYEVKAHYHRDQSLKSKPQVCRNLYWHVPSSVEFSAREITVDTDDQGNIQSHEHGDSIGVPGSLSVDVPDVEECDGPSPTQSNQPPPFELTPPEPGTRSAPRRRRRTTRRRGTSRDQSSSQLDLLEGIETNGDQED